MASAKYRVASDYFTKENCTVENVTPVVDELKVVLTGAVANLHALVGVDVNVLLLTEGGVKVTVEILAKLVAEIIIVSFYCFACNCFKRYPDFLYSLSSALLASFLVLLRALYTVLSSRSSPLLGKFYSSHSTILSNLCSSLPSSGLVGTILSIVLTLVGHVLVNLVAVVVGLIGEVIAIILKLNVSVCISILGL